jgi:glycine/D-amino acid oxidase-like deaminating enzyme
VLHALPAHADVAIVGAGFAGLATARALADRGVDVVVIEREAELGRHASGRGAGLGRQLAEDDDTTALTIAGAARLRAGLGKAWTPSGGILSFAELATFEAYRARARRAGIAHEPVDGRAVTGRWPQLAGLPVAAALLVPSDGLIDPRALLAALARGLRVVLGAGVSRLRAGDVETTVGTLRARVVVEATGAWAGALTKDPPLDVYKRHLFALEARPAEGPYVWHLGERELYVRGRGGETIACACDAEPTPPRDHEPSLDAAARLRARFAGLALADAPIARVWACQRAFAPDRRMRVGRDPTRPWLVWAAALGGHGATAAPAIGERAAEAVVAALRGER